jgi:hypothetical protein
MPEIADKDAAASFFAVVRNDVHEYVKREFSYIATCGFQEVYDKVLSAVSELEDHKRIAGKIKGTAQTAVQAAAVEKKVEDIICGNCHKKGHIRLDCSKHCSRCVPSCGKTPRFCPVQIKWDIEHPKATFSKKFSTPVYKSHNARLTQVSNDSRTAAALEKVRSRSSKRELKSSHTSIATSC